MSYDPNSILNDIRSKANSEKGYDISNLEEVKIVRNTLISLGLSTKIFDENLKTLKIISKGIPGYNPKENIIYGNVSGMDLIHELFHMASNSLNINRGHGAYTHNGFGMALDEGITDYLTEIACNGKYTCKYPVEKEIVRILIDVYSNKILKRYSEGNPKELYDVFGNDIKIIKNIIGYLTRYTMKIVFSRDIIIANNFKGNKLNAIGEIYDEAYESLLMGISKLINYLNSKNINRADNYLNDIEDVLYSRCKSDIEATSYRDFNNFIVDLERMIKKLERGV